MSIDCIGIGEVLKATGVSRTTLYRSIHEGRFPKPIYVGKRPRWRKELVSKWMERQERRNGDVEDKILTLAGN